MYYQAKPLPVGRPPSTNLSPQMERPSNSGRKTGSGQARTQTRTTSKSQKTAFDQYVEIVTSQSPKDQKEAYEVLKSQTRYGS